MIFHCFQAQHSLDKKKEKKLSAYVVELYVIWFPNICEIFFFFGGGGGGEKEFTFCVAQLQGGKCQKEHFFSHFRHKISVENSTI